MNKRIVMVTYGSLGDLHPYLSVGSSLKKSGCTVILACSERFRHTVETAGLDFVAVPPDLAPFEKDSEFQAKGLHPRTGAEYIIRNLFLPSLTESYNILMDVCREADLIISHVLAYAVPVVAEKLNIPWIQVFLQPGSTFSTGDAPVLAAAPFLKKIPFQHPAMYRLLYATLKLATRSWFGTIADLRRSAGLATRFAHPILESGSPHGTLGWFSQYLVTPQRDWSNQFRVVGFPAPWPEREVSLPDAVLHFLRTEHPLVFSLGSTAVFQPGNYYDVSQRVASRLRRPAVLLGHNADQNGTGTFIAPGILAIRYLPYSQVFPHSALVVHHGGIGGIHNVLRLGKPSLVVPFTYDQPDNANRLTQLGLALSLPRAQYNEERASALIDVLLRDSSFRINAEIMAVKVRREEEHDGAVSYILSYLNQAP